MEEIRRYAKGIIPMSAPLVLYAFMQPVSTSGGTDAEAERGGNSLIAGPTSSVHSKLDSLNFRPNPPLAAGERSKIATGARKWSFRAYKYLRTGRGAPGRRGGGIVRTKDDDVESREREEQDDGTGMRRQREERGAYTAGEDRGPRRWEWSLGRFNPLRPESGLFPLNVVNSA